MRLSPPITILALIAVSLGAIIVLQRNPACGLTPDGKPREVSWYNAISVEFDASPDCDVWEGIVPAKPIETIQLRRTSTGGASLIARISPDGTGFVAVIPPFGPRSAFSEIVDPTASDYGSVGRVFSLEQPDQKLYGKVVSLVAPLRDFQGENFGNTRDPHLRSVFELDDQRTRRIICLTPTDIMPRESGPTIEFKINGDTYPSKISLGSGCNDAAIRSGTKRINIAIDAIVDATRQFNAIKDEYIREFPLCKGYINQDRCKMIRL